MTVRRASAWLANEAAYSIARLDAGEKSMGQMMR
jgi:hypothetical protein